MDCRRVWTSIVLSSLWLTSAAWAAEPTRVGESLLFEAEDWTTPREAWLADRDTEDRWNLWSQNASAGWSGGVVLRSPIIREDRATPEAGAPPLHTRLEGIPPGVYEVVLNRTGRKLAVSLDGKNWRPTECNAEDNLGVFRIDDGTFQLWIDDRYCTPSNIGPGYYDYIRLDPFKPPTLSHFEAFAAPDKSGNPAGYEIVWTSDRPVPTGMLEIDYDGSFERVIIDRDGSPKLRNHRHPVPAFAWSMPRIKVRVAIPFAKDFEWTSEPVELTLPRGTTRQQAKPSIDIALTPAGPIVPERPILAGIPFSPSALWRVDELVAVDQAGNLPTQNTVAARWPDGSVRWLFTRVAARKESTEVRLVSAPTPSGSRFADEQLALVGEDAIRWNDRLLECEWTPERFALFDRVSRHGGRSITGKPELGNVRVIDGNGRAWGLGRPERSEWEETGPVRTVLRVEGHFAADNGEKGLAYRLRYFFTAGSPLVQVQLTLIHDVDGSEFQRIRSLAFRIPIAGEEPLRGQLPGGEPVDVTEPGRHELWQLDANRLRTITNGQTSEKSARSPGWAVVQRGGQEIALAVRDFWQTWPKSIALKPDGLHVRLLPELGKDKYVAKDLMDWMRQGYAFDDDGCYLLRGGMALRHEFWVRFGQAGDVVEQGGPDAWATGVLSLPYAAVDPEQYCRSGAFGPVRTAAADNRPEYEALVERNVRVVLDLRESAGEYGWMNFGDWHGERTYNWGNNEYDLSWTMALQFARTGRWDYFAVGRDMAVHHATVDTIHAPIDERMPGRVWTHCVGHVGAGDRMPSTGPAGGLLEAWLKTDVYNQHFYRGMVDASGHIYQEGNFAYYFLTGDRDLLERAEMVCSAQAAYLTPTFDFRIERGAGWPLSNAVAAYEATGNPYYLNAARIYVERILEKQDPVGGGWLLPQPPSECDGQTGIGGKAFATGILLYGLMRYDLVEPRPDVKDCIVNACRWLVEQTWNDEKAGFRYKTGCDLYRDDAGNGAVNALCLPGLAYGYELSSDERFLHVLHKGYAMMCAYTGTDGKRTGMVCRQSAFALPTLSATTRPHAE